MIELKCISLADMRPSAPPEKCVICLGNFDGVHLAHRDLMKQAKFFRNKKLPDAACGVFCFHAPSTDFLTSAPSAHLCTQEQKMQYFRETGLEYAFFADFPAIKDLSPTEFVQNILIDACHCVGVACGFNYRFGKGGVGTPELLVQTFADHAIVAGEICYGGKTVSSTRIRELLREGDVSTAATLLTRPYSFTAPVIHGKSLGQKLGSPTINQMIPSKMLIPRRGVYLTDCEIGGIHYRGISNIGVHPTMDLDAEINCETHLLDFSGDLYGKDVTVSFLKFIRPEQKFESIQQLREQIMQDIAYAKNNDSSI